MTYVITIVVLAVVLLGVGGFCGYMFGFAAGRKPQGDLCPWCSGGSEPEL